MTKIRHIFPIFFGMMCITACQQGQQDVLFVCQEYADSALLVPTAPAESPVCKSSIRLFLLQAKEESGLTPSIERINRYIIDEMLPDCRDIPEEKASETFVKAQIKEFAGHVRSLYYEQLEAYDEMEEMVGMDETSEWEEYDEELLKDSFTERYSYEYNITTEAHIGYADSIVCYTMKSYIYTGGAHPTTISRICSFSLTNGQVVRPSDIFRDGTHDELVDRLTKRLMEMNDAHSLDELQDMGYLDIADMFITNNMLLERNHIVFHYDTYELAPYAFGEIDISFTYAELEDLMNL